MLLQGEVRPPGDEVETLLRLEPAGAPEAPEAPVELANVDSRAMISTVNVTGTVVSRQDANLAAELEGRLSWVAEVGESDDGLEADLYA